MINQAKLHSEPWTLPSKPGAIEFQFHFNKVFKSGCRRGKGDPRHTFLRAYIDPYHLCDDGIIIWPQQCIWEHDVGSYNSPGQAERVAMDWFTEDGRKPALLLREDYDQDGHILEARVLMAGLKYAEAI